MLALELWVRPEGSVIHRNGAWKQEAIQGRKTSGIRYMLQRLKRSSQRCWRRQGGLVVSVNQSQGFNHQAVSPALSPPVLGGANRLPPETALMVQINAPTLPSRPPS